MVEVKHLSVFVLLALSTTLAEAKTYCSLRIEVKTSDPFRPLVPITVEEPNSPSQSATTRGGEVEFCGLGILPITIRVGDTACSQVIVTKVRLRWGVTSRVVVHYDSTSCNINEGAKPGCVFVLRFIDLEKKPISEVTLQSSSDSVSAYPSDEFGRMHVGIRFGSSMVGTAQKAPFKPTDLRLDCPKYTDDAKEQLITLSK